MTPIDEPASFAPQGPAPEGRKAETPSASPEVKADLFAFTVDAATGRLVRAEAADAAGGRKELSDGEWRSLAQADATLETIVEQAFEAGIACVLGDAARDDEPPQSEADADLSRALLRSLIERSGARRLMDGDVLSRAIVATLIARAPRVSDATSEGSVPH
jgi:hypothetical protein